MLRLAPGPQATMLGGQPHVVQVAHELVDQVRVLHAPASLPEAREHANREVLAFVDSADPELAAAVLLLVVRAETEVELTARFWAAATLRSTLRPAAWQGVEASIQDSIVRGLVELLGTAAAGDAEAWPVILTRQLGAAVASAVLLIGCTRWPSALVDIRAACGVAVTAYGALATADASTTVRVTTLLTVFGALPELAGRSVDSFDLRATASSLQVAFTGVVAPLLCCVLNGPMAAFEELVLEALDCLRCWTACDVPGVGCDQRMSWAPLATQTVGDSVSAAVTPPAESLFGVVVAIFSTPDTQARFTAAGHVLVEALQWPIEELLSIDAATPASLSARLQARVLSVLQATQAVLAWRGTYLDPAGEPLSPQVVVELACVLLERQGRVLADDEGILAQCRLAVDCDESTRLGLLNGLIHVLTLCSGHHDLERVASPPLELWASLTHHLAGPRTARTHALLRSTLPQVLATLIARCQVPATVSEQAWVAAKYHGVAASCRGPHHPIAVAALGGARSSGTANGIFAHFAGEAGVDQVDELLRYRLAVMDAVRGLSRVDLATTTNVLMAAVEQAAAAQELRQVEAALVCLVAVLEPVFAQDSSAETLPTGLPATPLRSSGFQSARALHQRAMTPPTSPQESTTQASAAAEIGDSSDFVLEEGNWSRVLTRVTALPLALSPVLACGVAEFAGELTPILHRDLVAHQLHVQHLSLSLGENPPAPLAVQVLQLLAQLAVVPEVCRASARTMTSLAQGCARHLHLYTARVQSLVLECGAALSVAQALSPGTFADLLKAAVALAVPLADGATTPDEHRARASATADLIAGLLSPILAQLLSARPTEAQPWMAAATSALRPLSSAPHEVSALALGLLERLWSPVVTLVSAWAALGDGKGGVSAAAASSLQHALHALERLLDVAASAAVPLYTSTTVPFTLSALDKSSSRSSAVSTEVALPPAAASAVVALATVQVRWGHSGEDHLPPLLITLIARVMTTCSPLACANDVATSTSMLVYDPEVASAVFYLLRQVSSTAPELLLPPCRLHDDTTVDEPTVGCVAWRTVLVFIETAVAAAVHGDDATAGWEHAFRVALSFVGSLVLHPEHVLPLMNPALVGDALLADLLVLLLRCTMASVQPRPASDLLWTLLHGVGTQSSVRVTSHLVLPAALALAIGCDASSSARPLAEALGSNKWVKPSSKRRFRATLAQLGLVQRGMADPASVSVLLASAAVGGS